MSCQPFSSATTVSEALGAASSANRVFLRHRTACIGCYLARFCTLKDVAEAYGLQLDDLLAQLQQAAPATTTYITGEQHDAQR